MKELVTPKQALNLVFAKYRRFGVQRADLEDIASKALLAHWRDYRRGKFHSVTEFYRDMTDAWRNHTGCRKKTGIRFITGIVEDWWLSRTA